MGDSAQIPLIHINYKKIMTHPYVHALQEQLKPSADPAQARPMAKYMRDQFIFLGLPTPQRRELVREFISQEGLPAVEQLPAVVTELWALPEREYQYTALDLLHKVEKKLPAGFISTYEQLITTKSWWDTVDDLAAHGIATHFGRFPEVKAHYLAQWRSSNNIWLRRTTLLFQLHYKQHTDEALLFALVHENSDSSEFFIQKAIGWALREYSKQNREAVIKFVAETDLPRLSQREALKWLKNHPT